MSDVAYDVEQIRKYLQGRLSEEEEILFQDRLARDPLLVRELEQSLRMRQGLRQLQAEGYFARPVRRTTDAYAQSLLRWLPLAAAAVIAVVCLDVWREAPQPLLTTAAGAPVEQTFNLIPMRGADDDTLSLPAHGNVEFRARPQTLIATSYRITLLRDGKRLDSVVVAAADTEQYLDVFADSARLAPGRYLLQIESASAEPPGPPVTYSFTLQRHEGAPAR